MAKTIICFFIFLSFLIKLIVEVTKKEDSIYFILSYQLVSLNCVLYIFSWRKFDFYGDVLFALIILGSVLILLLIDGKKEVPVYE